MSSLDFYSEAKEELKKIADDTHRTVTLRIPKEKTLGEALWEAYRASEDYDEMAFTDWFYDMPDTDLQKALDEVQPNE